MIAGVNGQNNEGMCQGGKPGTGKLYVYVVLLLLHDCDSENNYCLCSGVFSCFHTVGVHAGDPMVTCYSPETTVTTVASLLMRSIPHSRYDPL